MNSTTDGNETTDNVDLTKPKVNLIDIASPNMTPEASKVVSDALERSAKTMNNTVKEAENIRLTRLREEVTEIVYGVGWRDEPGLNKAFMPDVEAILYAVEKYNGPVQIEPPLVAPTERDIDKILHILAVTGTYQDAGQTCLDGDAITRAKQAITSLTKELVAEAKPEVKAHPLGPVTLADCQRGLDQFEQNLLKALEEK
jgi:hypothetical protein